MFIVRGKWALYLQLCSGLHFVQSCAHGCGKTGIKIMWSINVNTIKTCFSENYFKDEHGIEICVCPGYTWFHVVVVGSQGYLILHFKL